MVAEMDGYNRLPAYGGDDGRGALNGMRIETDCTRLPPLNEAVPEIHQTIPSNGHQGQQLRSYYDVPKSTAQFPEAKSLAPSPLMSTRSRAPTASRLASQRHSSPGAASENICVTSTSSSAYSERRRGSYASTTSSASQSTMMRPSPVASPHPAIATSFRSHAHPQNHYNLPSISSFSPDERSDPYRRDSYSYPASNESRKPYVSYPQYSNVPSPEYYNSNGPYQDRPPFPGPSGNSAYHPSFDNLSEYSDSKNKRRRGNLPKAVTDILRAWFMNHVAHPYPTEAEKQELIARTGLTISQISNWFINARRRNLPVMTKSAQAESELLHLQNERHRMSSDDDVLPTLNR